MSESTTFRKSSAGEELEKSILHKIESGELVAGDMILSERKLAELHKISYMTARKSINKLVQKNYLIKKNRKGTFVAGSVLPKPPMNQDLVISTCEEDTISQIKSPFNWFIMMRTMKGITRGCVDFGIKPIFKHRNDDIFADNVSNIVLYHPLSLRDLDFLQKRGLPFIAIHEVYDEIHDCCMICDRRRAFYRMTRHLIELGHQRILYFGPGMEHPFFRSRFDGYSQAMQESGLEPRQLENPAVEDVDEYYQKVAGYLRKNPPPDAIVAGNDFRAIQTVQAIRDAGLRVPGDVAITGYDGVDEGRSMVPGLTTCVEPVEEMAYEAVRFIAEWLRKGKPEKSIIVRNPEFIIRESCGTGR